MLTVAAGHPSAAGAVLRVDGEVISNLPVSNLVLAAGSHTCAIERAGYRSLPLTCEVVPSEGRVQEITVPELVRETGCLQVGGGPEDNLGHVPVYLDASLLGPSPGTWCGLDVGDHLVELRPDGAPPQEDHVRVETGKTQVVPARRLHEAPDDIAVSLDVDRAESYCETGYLAGCLVAAHGILHPPKGRPGPGDLDRAGKLYGKVCVPVHSEASDAAQGVAGSPWACRGLGYVLAQQGRPEAEGWLYQACLGGEREACWDRYRPLATVPAPPLDRNAKEWWGRREGKGDNHLAFGIFTGAAPNPAVPVHVELRTDVDFGVNPYLQIPLGGVLAFRTDSASDAMMGAPHRLYGAGPGVSLGVLVLPLRRQALTLRVEGRITGFVLDSVTPGASTMIGHAFGVNRFEVGVIVEAVPIEVRSVSAFGGITTAERRPVLPTLGLRYDFLGFQL